MGTKLNLQVDSAGELGMNRQIAGQLEEKILSGEIQPGEKLPSETDLANELNVSRDVVRRAYAILKDNGFIETIKKRDGCHVKSHLNKEG